MLVIIYIFALVIAEAASHHLLKTPSSPYADSLHDDWGSVRAAVFTLFKSMSSGVNWGEPAESLLQVDGFYVVLLMVYQCLMLFALQNVITGFFCEHAIDMAQSDKEELVQEQLRDKEVYEKLFKDIFHSIDADKSGFITLSELEAFLLDERQQAFFTHLNISAMHAWTVFRLLDIDGNGTIEIDEFIKGLMGIRGPATAIDVRTVQHDIKRTGLSPPQTDARESTRSTQPYVHPWLLAP